MSFLTRLLMVCALAALGLTPEPASAQTAPPRQPIEPDVTLVNLPTTLSLPAHKFNFRLTHRFQANLRQGTFGQNLSNLFGLDSGAIIALEVRFAPIRRVQVVVSRTNLDKTFQFAARYDVFRQGGRSPISLSALLPIEGTNNFRLGPAEAGHEEHQHGAGGEGHRSPSIGAVVSRTIGDRLALYATPVFVHHTLTLAGEHENGSIVGLGGRLRVRRTVYVVVEAAPRASGEARGDAEFGFGIEKRVCGHMFQLTFRNSLGTTFGQLVTGGTPHAIYMGFNLSRKFF